MGEEETRTRARRTEATPRATEAEEHNLDRAVLRSWCPHWVKRKAESCGHEIDKDKERRVPDFVLDYTHTHTANRREGG